MRQFWREYWGAFRWGSLKKYLSGEAAVAMAIMMGCVGAILAASVREFDWQELYMAICILLPYGFTLMSMQLHPIRQEKVFYMLPLSPEERNDKIRREYIFRSILHAAISMLGGLAVMLVTGWSLVGFLALTVNAILFGFCACRDRAKQLSVCLSILAPCVLFMNLLILDYIQEGGFGKIIMVLVVMVMIELPLMLGHGSKMKKWFKEALHYEEVTA